MVTSLALPAIIQPTARTRTLNDENKNGFTDSFNPQRLPPHRYPSFSSPARSDYAASPRQPRGRTPATSATLESRRRWRRRPRIGGNRVAIQIQHDRAHVASAPASVEEPRESDVRCWFSGVSSPRGTAVEELRAEAARREDEFDGERTRGYRCARDSVEASHCYDV
jgi:hypothetical protein